MRIEGEGGKVFTLYTNLDRLEQHMKELAPEDSDTIEEFIKGVRKCTKIDLPVDKAAELYGPIDGLKMLPHLGFMKKWSKLTAIDITSRLKNPFLREALSGAFLGDFFPLIFMLLTFAWLHNKEAGYLIGGALEIAGAMERRYVGLGGEIHCKSRVNKILVENDKAVGVRLEDGTEHRSDIVISAADGRTTIFDMLGGKYLNDEIKGYYDKPKLFNPLIYRSGSGTLVR